MINIYLIQNAKTWADELFIYGKDYSISDEGIKQIRKCKKFYIGLEPDEIYSSALKRCMETACGIFPDKKIETLSEFNELNLGKMEGLPYKKNETNLIAKRFEYDFNSLMKLNNGDSSLYRSLAALSKMQLLANQIILHPENYKTKNIFIFTSDIIMRSIVLTFKMGARWNGLGDLPKLNNLETIKFEYEESNSYDDTLSKISVVLPSEGKMVRTNLVWIMKNISNLQGKCTSQAFFKIKNKILETNNFESIVNKHYYYAYNDEYAIDQLKKGDIDIAYNLIWNFIKDYQTAEFISGFVQTDDAISHWLEVNEKS